VLPAGFEPAKSEMDAAALGARAEVAVFWAAIQALNTQLPTLNCLGNGPGGRSCTRTASVLSGLSLLLDYAGEK
jgi:hypothetical protein